MVLLAACSTTRPALFLEDYRGRDLDVITRDGRTLRARLAHGPGFAFYIRQDVAVPSEEIARVVYTDRATAAFHGLGFGLLAGAALGAVGGAVLHPLDCNDCDDDPFNFQRRDSAVVFGVLGGLAGAVVGTVIGIAKGRSVTFSFDTAEDRRLLVGPTGVTWRF